MATSNDDQTRAILDNTIFLLIPSFNPDGQDIVGEWFKKIGRDALRRMRGRRSSTASTSGTTTTATATC